MATRFSGIAATGLDANDTATVSDALDISENNFVAYSVQTASGTHASHIVTLQCSLDGTTWHDSTSTLTRTGFVDNVRTTTRFVRLKISTAEGEASTIDIIIQAK